MNDLIAKTCFVKFAVFAYTNLKKLFHQNFSPRKFLPFRWLKKNVVVEKRCNDNNYPFIWKCLDNELVYT